MRRRKTSKKKHEKPPPEGPEVRTITLQLDEALKTHVLEDVTVLSGRYVRHAGPSGLTEFKKSLPQVILSVACKGKFIYFMTSSPQTTLNKTSIWNTLGMTGYWSKTNDNHARLKLKTSVGDFYFCDMRNFGTMVFNKTEKQLAKKLGTLGIDLLTQDLTSTDLRALFRKRSKKTMAEVLMDQTILAGVGNYIKCEALYLSEISPHRQPQSLSDDELERLLASLAHVMRSSFRAKGHSMSNYQDLEGEKGMFKFDLAVYNRKNDPLGNPVIKEETLDGRTTHWVPGVQR